MDRTGRRVAEWYLKDVRLLDERHCARDLSLRDLTIEASVQESQPDYPYRPPLSPGYRLLSAQGRPLGHCRDLACVREPVPEPEEPSIRLVGCVPRGALHRALAVGDEDLGHAKILRLDAQGRTLQYAVEGEILAWTPSGRGLVDLTLEPWSPRPPLAAREVWDLWWPGWPAQRNLWARCGSEGRRYWLVTALENHARARRDPDAPPGTTYHLDGRYVTDESGFYCALGEAVNGPGGYFGHNPDSLIDCLCGHFGARAPFTLVWHDSATARACLGVTPQTARPATFEELGRALRQWGVETVLA
ncbi:barstar family protein [Streptomyces sulfonofaciens]|uniref:barstar family protein n=1 Tax=Streptomyces sulfonofaciens TaxID=68272 RepID=UPI001671E2DF|nr:barstar family protein [Streptomyces sulfonofaciens]